MRYYLLTSLILSFVGAALDFESASANMLTRTISGMVVYADIPFNVNTLILLLNVFGVILAVTGVASITAIGARHMKVIGGLMVCYGVVMAVIGYVMWASAGMMFQSMMFFGTAMLILGALMLINGAAMIYGDAMMFRNMASTTPRTR
ncbi:MAG: hypothetical protein JRN20_15440 [Nitrososphaerota archaeon]|nr:hypothetical protein [Nitrososphaerota archaeon]